MASLKLVKGCGGTIVRDRNRHATKQEKCLLILKKNAVEGGGVSGSESDIFTIRFFSCNTAKCSGFQSFAEKINLKT
jgi:hypothetical protein